MNCSMKRDGRQFRLARECNRQIKSPRNLIIKKEKEEKKKKSYVDRRRKGRAPARRFAKPRRTSFTLLRDSIILAARLNRPIAKRKLDFFFPLLGRIKSSSSLSYLSATEVLSSQRPVVHDLNNENLCRGRLARRLRRRRSE